VPLAGDVRTDDCIKMRQGGKIVSALRFCNVICELSVKDRNRQKMKSLFKFTQGCRTVGPTYKATELS